MARLKPKKLERETEPPGAAEAVRWWRRRILEAWTRGEVAVVRRRMAAILGWAQASAEWEARGRGPEPRMEVFDNE
jgi:hypothetical protein